MDVEYLTSSAATAALLYSQEEFMYAMVVKVIATGDTKYMHVGFFLSNH